MSDAIASLAATSFADPSIGRDAIHISLARTETQTRALLVTSEAALLAGETPVVARIRFLDLPAATVPDPMPGDHVEFPGTALAFKVRARRRGLEGNVWRLDVAPVTPWNEEVFQAWLALQEAA